MSEAPVARLLGREPTVVTVGVPLLADALRAQAVTVEPVDWSPPDPGVLPDLEAVMADPRRVAANGRAVGRMLAAGAQLVDVLPARQALGLAPGEFLHAGPPIDWERASGPLRGALVGAALLEGLAEDPAQAARMLAGSGMSLSPCHHHHAVGPMAGVISPSMWGFVLYDAEHDRTAYATLNEGLGAVLRFGAYGPPVLDRLRWMGAVLGPLLQRAVRAHRDSQGPIDVKAILAQMLAMGDEGHNRNRAGSLLFLREILPDLATTGAPGDDLAAVLAFMGGNEHFFLNLGMPACKLAADAARDEPGSTVVVAMARNGTDFGIQVSGTGDRWFTAPAEVPDALFFPGYGPEDANPDIGDSAITETAGLGGFAMAAAPAIVRFVGGDVPQALTTTQTMDEITLAQNPAFQIPVLGFRGTPTGIDVTRVVRTGVRPQINTGVAGRVAGTGQVGAGLVNPPAAVFPAALAELARRVPAAQPATHAGADEQRL